MTERQLQFRVGLLVVIGLAFLLLTFAFRTILVPIKSILGFGSAQ